MLLTSLLSFFNINISKSNYSVHNWIHAALNCSKFYTFLIILRIQYRAKITPNSVKNIVVFFQIFTDYEM